MIMGKGKPATPPGHTAAPAALTEEQLYHASQAELSQPDTEGRTLLHLAVLQGSIDLVDILLKRKVDVNVGDNLGSTPLHEAIAGENLPIIAHLLDAGADINARDAALRTPLFYAVQYGFTDIAEMLLERGTDVNAQDVMGRSPLHEAVESNQFSVLHVLLRRRANTSLAARDGKTALDMAKKLDRKAMIDVLQRFQSAQKPAEEPAAEPAAPETAELERLRAELETLRAQRQSTGSTFDALCDAMLDAVPGSVYLLRPDGAFAYISKSAARKLGVSQEALLGQRWSAPPFPAQAAEIFDHRREEVLASGQSATGVMHLPANGTVYNYRYTVTPVRDGEAVSAVMVIMHDDQGKADLEERLTRAHYTLHDTETKLSRERAAREALERELAQARGEQS